jgi:hypothetical protein
MVHSLRESGRCNRSPLLLFHVVQEGVGFDRLQTLFYYLKLPPQHIIPCCPDCLPCSRPEWPPLCGRVWGCCKYGLCESCQTCSHESNSNFLKMGLNFLGPACHAVPGGAKPSIPSTRRSFPLVVLQDESWPELELPPHLCPLRLLLPYLPKHQW